MELAAGGAHRVDCGALCSVLQRLGYSAKLHESTASLYTFKQGVRHQYITVCLPGGFQDQAVACCAACVLPEAVILQLSRTQPSFSLQHSAFRFPPCLILATAPATCAADASLAGLSTVIVEPNFRDCFCIAHPTPRFEALLDSLPAAVVASRVSVPTAVRPPLVGPLPFCSLPVAVLDYPLACPCQPLANSAAGSPLLESVPPSDARPPFGGPLS